MRSLGVSTSEGDGVPVPSGVVLGGAFRTGCFASARSCTMPKLLALEAAARDRYVGMYYTPNESSIDVFRKFRSVKSQDYLFCWYFYIVPAEGDSPDGGNPLILQAF